MKIEISNSQRMALCTFLLQYTVAMLEPGSTLSQVSIDCSVFPVVETTPTDLLNMFMDLSEMEAHSGSRPI